MSRGLGRLERAIAARIERQRQAHIAVCVRVDEIVWDAYPRRLVVDMGEEVERPDLTRAHLVAAHRAMHSFVRKYPHYGLIGGKRGWPLELVSVSAARRWASLWREDPVSTHADRQRSTARRNRKRRA